jgi:hypothetical protein
MESSSTENKKRGCIGCLVVIIAIIAISTFSGLFNSNSKAPENEPAATPSQKQIDDFNKWYSEIMEIHKKADVAMQKYQSIAKKLEQSSDLYSAYSSVSDIKETVHNSWTAMGKIKTPSSLSKAHQNTLSEAKTELQTGLFSRKQGLEKILQFLDDPKPSSLEKAKSEFQSAETFMYRGIAKIISVQSELGITPE